jgi:hypothetical protein
MDTGHRARGAFQREIYWQQRLQPALLQAQKDTCGEPSGDVDQEEGAFEGIVPPDLFYTAQGILRERAHRFSNEELIEKLRRLLRHHGHLSGLIIDEAEGMPSAAVYAHRFGSLIRAYQTVGFTPDRDYQYLEVNQFLRRLHPEIVGQNRTEDRRGWRDSCARPGD